MRQFILAGASLLLAAICPAISRAQTNTTDPPFPYDRLPTTVVGISPQEGWRTAYFDENSVVGELGEITPDADVRQWRNLISYFEVPTSATPDVSAVGDAIAGVAPHCIASAVFQNHPAGSAADDQWATIVCFTPDGPQTLAGAPLQIYLFHTLRTRDATFRLWRAWRGSSTEAVTMARATGVGLAGRLPQQPTSADLQRAFAPALQAIIDHWASELRSTLEICDLAASPCASLNHSLTGEGAYPLLIARAPLAQFAALTAVHGNHSNEPLAAQIYERVFRAPPPASNQGIAFANLLQPHNSDLRAGHSLQLLALSMMAGSKSAGGFFAIAGDAPFTDADAPAHMRAYLLKVARIAASAPQGPAYDSFQFDLWPND